MKEAPEPAPQPPAADGAGAQLRMCTMGEGVKTLGQAVIGLFPGLKPLALTPMICFLFVPLSLLLPAASVLYVNCLRRERDAHGEQAHPGSWLELRGRLAAVVLLSLLWWMITYMLVQLLGMQVDEAAAGYARQVQGSNQLQIGTPEQLEFSQAVLRYAMIYGLLALMALAAIWAMTQNVISRDPDTGPLRGLRGLMLNLPVMLLYAGLFTVAEFFVEQQFAHYKMLALEKLMLGQPYSDPGLPFLILRLYLAHVFLSAMLVITMKAFRALP